MRLLTVLFLVVGLGSCNGPIAELDQDRRTELMDIMNEAIDLANENRFQEARERLSWLDSVSQVEDDLYVRSRVYANFAWISRTNEQYQKALEFYEISNALALKNGDTALWVRNSDRVARALRTLNQYSKSAAKYEETLDFALLINDTARLATSSNSLGNVLVELMDYEKALKYYNDAAKYWSIPGEESSFAIAIHNQGDALRGMGLLNDALDTYQRALKLKKNYNSTTSSAYTLTGMGRTYLLMDSIDRADEVLQEAIDIRSKLRNKNSYAESLLIMSRVSLARNQFRKAERQLKEVEQIARGNDKADLLRDAFEDQRALYKKWGRFRQLAEVDENYDLMTDSLYREEKLKVQEAQSAANLQREQQRTELEKQGKELAELERDAESQKALFSIIIGILACVGLLVIGWQLLQIRKRNAILVALNARIKLITDNAFHSQKNALGLISALMRSKARQAENEKELEVLKDVEGKIEALGGVSKYLFQRRIEDNTAVAAKIQLKTYLEELVEDTFESIASKADLDIEVDDIETTSTEALNVGLITNEAVTNFSKYAESQGAETLMIRVLKKAEKLFLSFIDDGPGFPEGFDFSSSTGFGMQMMANLVADMEGTIQLKREDDLTQIDIRIPLKS